MSTRTLLAPLLARAGWGRPFLRVMDPRTHLLMEMPKGSVCAEIGVHEGGFARRILDIVKPKRLHLVDPWKHEEGEQYENALYGGLGPGGETVMETRYKKVRERFENEIRSGQVVIHRDVSHVVVREFEAHYFDWIYIDGNHLYDFVKQDLELYHGKVKPGGFLTGDDYGVRGWWGDGVERAVTEFMSRNPGLTLSVRKHQFIIRRRAGSLAG